MSKRPLLTIQTKEYIIVNFQVSNIEGALDWIKTCPYEHTISSMQGGFIHIKIFIPMNKEVK